MYAVCVWQQPDAHALMVCCTGPSCVACQGHTVEAWGAGRPECMLHTAWRAAVGSLWYLCRCGSP